MSEIEKMYENAGVKKEVIPCPAKYYGYDCTRNNWDDEDCSCDIEGYPPFTAEKQLKLIELFISSIWWENLKILYKTLDCSLNFEDKLAKLVNYLWLSLSEEEKQQVKGILE